jgi:DNA-binding GntR family transcriptional regulator
LRSKTKVEKEGEVDRVYRLLKQSILQCELMPGDFLAEVQLARDCKTSRTPIREACNRLSQEHWIARIPRKGYLVPPISVRDLVEIYEYRKLLECFTAEKVAQTASSEQIAEIAEIVEVERRPSQTMAEILEVNGRFHIGIAEIAGNQRVLDQLKLTLEYIHRLDILSTQREPGFVPHADIVAALEARQPTRARDAMAAHVDYARDRMLKLFGS